MDNLIVQIFCKAVEFFLIIRTILLRGFEKDKTKILIDNFTRAQEEAVSYQKSTQSPLTSEFENSPCRLLVIVPFRDKWKMTETCAEAVLKQHLVRQRILLVLVDNGSTELDTLLGMGSFKVKWAQHFGSGDKNLEIIIRHDAQEFNFSRINNDAVKAHADFRADFILFLNNDCFLETATALKQLMSFALATPSAGAIGCTLLYPDRRVQHLFLAPGIKLGGAHPCKGIAYNAEDAWYAEPRPVAAVTGAFLFVKATTFSQVGAFHSSLALSCQDLDFCLACQKFGYVNWVLPNVIAIHHETTSRRAVNSFSEIRFLNERWGIVLHFNKYFSRSFSRWSEKPLLSFVEGMYPWQQFGS